MIRLDFSVDAEKQQVFYCVILGVRGRALMCLFHTGLKSVHLSVRHQFT